MSRRLVALLACLAVVSSLLIACGDAGTDGEGEPTKRRFLSLGTAPAGGAFFVVGAALADVADQAIDGWRVTAEATQGSQENIRRLAAGDLSFALSNAAITWFAVRGEGSFDRAYETRAVMTLAPNVALFVAPSSRDINSIADLRGKRVVIGPPGAGFDMFVGKLLEGHGLTLDDLDVSHATQAGAVDLLADGNAAAAFLGGAVPTASITQASTSMDLVFVPFDAGAKAQLVEDYAFFEPATIPAGTYRGQDAAYDGLNVGSMHVITDARVPEDEVYAFTKAIYENRDAVVERHPAGRAIQPQRVVRDLGTPFHPGAVRYYREIGIWPEETTEEKGQAPEAAAESAEATAADDAEVAPPAPVS
ncbi:MAG: TAXI family TRAP transporter solute-binding subunit [Acidobacteriota bacterium]